MKIRHETARTIDVRHTTNARNSPNVIYPIKIRNNKNIVLHIDRTTHTLNIVRSPHGNIFHCVQLNYQIFQKSSDFLGRKIPPKWVSRKHAVVGLEGNTDGQYKYLLYDYSVKKSAERREYKSPFGQKRFYEKKTIYTTNSL